MKKNLLQIFILICLLGNKIAISQVKFTTTVTPGEISKNDYAALKLIVENVDNVQQLSLPALKNFTIVGGPNQESGTTIINNVVKKYIALTYFIKPNTTGKLSIPPASAIVDGKKLTSNATSLQVNNNTSSKNNNPNSPFVSIDHFMEEAVPINDNILKKGESAEDKIQKDMFIKVDVDRTSCFINEPVVVAYKLYTRLKRGSLLSKNPSFNGFSVIDLQRADNSNYSRETVNGREYNVYIIRKAQLYPLQPGNIEIEKAEVENTIQFVKEDYIVHQGQIWDDIFSDFTQATLPPEAIENHKVTLQSKPIFITVKPLPEKGKPANFKGAVGDFEISAELKKDNLTTDEAGKLLLQIKGEGNLQLVTAPDIVWPKGIEGYDPKITNTLNKLSTPVSGNILYEYDFTVDSAGKYLLPAITFSYFDNKTASYKTSSTQPINFTVAKGEGIKKSNIVERKESKGAFNTLIENRWLVIVTLALLIITSLFFWLKKENKKSIEANNLLLKNVPEDIKEPSPDNNITKNWLAQTEEYLNDNDIAKFYNELNSAFKNYLSNKFNIAVAQLDKKSLMDYFTKENISENVSSDVINILERIQWQLYTPYPDRSQQQELFEKTKKLIADIDAS
jgi:hypothetical protein